MRTAKTEANYGGVLGGKNSNTDVLKLFVESCIYHYILFKYIVDVISGKRLWLCVHMSGDFWEYGGKSWK